MLSSLCFFLLGALLWARIAAEMGAAGVQSEADCDRWFSRLPTADQQRVRRHTLSGAALMLIGITLAFVA